MTMYEDNPMDFEQFKEEVMARIPEYLPDDGRGVETWTVPVLREGDQLETAMAIRREGDQGYPRIYLDEPYEEFRDGRSLESVLSDISDTYQESLGLSESAQRASVLMSDPEQRKQQISYRLVNRESNRNGLQQRPWRPVAEDLALIYSVELNNGTRIPVNNELATKMDLTEEDLYRLSCDNTPNLCPAEISTIGRAMGLGDEVAPSMLVVTNREQSDGACVLLYPGVQEQIRDMLGCDFYALPSSVHEMLAVPKEPEALDRLKQMVHDVNHNRTVMRPEDILSERVFEIRDGELIPAVEHQERTMPAPSLGGDAR